MDSSDNDNDSEVYSGSESSSSNESKEDNNHSRNDHQRKQTSDLSGDNYSDDAFEPVENTDDGSDNEQNAGALSSSLKKINLDCGDVDQQPKDEKGPARGKKPKTPQVETKTVNEVDGLLHQSKSAIDIQPKTSVRKLNSSSSLKLAGFTQYKLKEIERDNSILMSKIIRQNTRQPKFTPVRQNGKKQSSNAINRKKEQKKIEADNLILLKKIQRAKPFGLSRR